MERCGGVGNRRLPPEHATAPAAAPASAHESAGLGTAAKSSREASTKVIEDTATWIKGKHNVTFGGSMVQADVWLAEPDAGADRRLRPHRRPKPANAMFNAANFPGASAAGSSRRRTNLYAMLTGRITSIHGDARINAAGDAYVPLGRLARAKAACASSTSSRPTRGASRRALTVSAGLRYVLANPFYPINNSYTTVTEDGLYGISGVGNLFKPGTLTGTKPLSTSVSRRAPTPTTPTGTTSRRAAAFAWQLPGHDKRLRAAAARVGGRRQRDPRRRRDGVPAARHVGLHRRVRREPGHSGQL